MAGPAPRDQENRWKQYLEDERIALFLQNEEFMKELQRNRDFLLALERGGAPGPGGGGHCGHGFVAGEGSWSGFSLGAQRRHRAGGQGGLGPVDTRPPPCYPVGTPEFCQQGHESPANSSPSLGLRGREVCLCRPSSFPCTSLGARHRPWYHVSGVGSRGASLNRGWQSRSSQIFWQFGLSLAGDLTPQPGSLSPAGWECVSSGV